MNELAEARPVGLNRSYWPVGAVASAAAVSIGTVVAVAVAVRGAPVSSEALAIGMPVLLFGGTVVLSVGLIQLARARDRRFAGALLGAGVLWALSALAASSHPGLYTVGRVAQWAADLALVYLVLAYPSGRLRDDRDRALFRGVALIVGLFYLPTLLVVSHFPVPSTWSNCTVGCPANPLALTHQTPAVVTDLLVPARETLSVALFLAVFFVVRRRGDGGGPLVRRMYAPIVVIALGRVVVLAAYFVTRRVAPGTAALDVLSWAYVLMLPAVAAAALVGRLYPRLFAATALDLIGRGLSASATAVDVRRVLGAALEDPGLRLFHSFPGDSGAWVDELGAPVALSARATDQSLTEVASGNWRIAVAHDRALAEDPVLVRTAGYYALTALENRRLSGDLRASLRELADSRSRILGAEDRERQKIERDLHDGAQQRLVSIRIRLGIAAEQLGDRDPAGAASFQALGHEIDAAIDEVRSLARGIYPVRLERTGVGEALREAGRASALPTTVHAGVLKRYPHEIEATVYFSCSEALQNAAKHAVGATAVNIWLWQDSETLHFEVRDDGGGFDVADTPLGNGLCNLRSRLAAVGGTHTIQSVPGRGTVVGGSIPI